MPAGNGAVFGIVEDSRAGAVLRVRARPRSPRDEVLGVVGGALRVAVRAAPEGGKANAAVVRTVASWLGLPASRVSLRSGGAARDKRLLIEGETAPDLRKCIAGLLGAGGRRTG